MIDALEPIRSCARRLWPLLSFVITLIALVAPAAPAQAQPARRPTIEMFSREGCPRCASAKEFLAKLAADRPDVQIVVIDVGSDPEARDRLRALAREHGVPAPGLPSFLVGGAFVTGFIGPETTGARLIAALEGEPGAGARDGRGPGAVPEDAVCPVEPERPCPEALAPGAPDDSVDLPVLGRASPRELGLPLFTLVMGLLDGFNPCAMWVLLLLLSFLVGVESRPRMLAVGATFVIVSGVVYFAFMAAWLNVFLLIGLSRGVEVSIAALAIVVGAINIKDFFAFKRGVSLTISDSVKPGLYRRMRAVAQAEHLPAAILGAGVLAVLVNAVELLCTAGLPAIYTRILTLRALPPWQYYGYLLLYNLAYVADDALMLAIALVTLGRRKLQEREGRWLKLVSGLVMAALGSILLARPSLLG